MKYTSKLILNGTEYEFGAGGGGGWQPGANTIAYFPLNSTYTNTDQSGNNNNGTTVGTLSYDSLACQFSSGNYITIPTIIPYGSNPYTISCYIYTSDVSGHQNWFYNQYRTGVENTASGLYIYNGQLCFWGKGGGYDWDNICSISANTWYNVIITYDGNRLTAVVNDNVKGIFIRTINTSAPTIASIGAGGDNNVVACVGKVSNLIIENKVRTDQEISDYFDQTKSLYGIS